MVAFANLGLRKITTRLIIAALHKDIFDASVVQHLAQSFAVLDHTDQDKDCTPLRSELFDRIDDHLVAGVVVHNTDFVGVLVRHTPYIGVFDLEHIHPRLRQKALGLNTLPVTLSNNLPRIRNQIDVPQVPPSQWGSGEAKPKWGWTSRSNLVINTRSEFLHFVDDQTLSGL